MEQSETISRIASTSKRLLSSMRAAAAPARMLVQRPSTLNWVKYDARQAQRYGDTDRLGDRGASAAGG